MTMLLDDGFNQVNGPSTQLAAGWGGGLLSLANAATSWTSRPAQPMPTQSMPAQPMPAQAVPTQSMPAQPMPAQAVEESGRSLVSPAVIRDHAIQAGAFRAERAAREIALMSARLAPEGQPRVQPVLFGRHTVYHAELVGLSEAEARSVCANLSRRVAACQVFRTGAGLSVQR
jgi:hypothetical protein